MQNERIRHLKIKIVNLADEARTIRAEEKKVVKQYRRKHGGELTNKTGSYIPGQSILAEHRRGRVREAARANLLAYAYLRGVPYECVESPNTVKPIDWPRVRKIIQTFGGDGNETKVRAWRAGKLLAQVA